MKRRWTDDHGADGLRAKFRVYKPRDAVELAVSTVVPAHAHIGDDGEFIFVLRPETDLAAYMALREYVAVVSDSRPQLASDMRDELNRIQGANIYA